MNPILPLEYCIPDVEARVFADGKTYLYGSYDLIGNSQYCSKEYHVFSSLDLKTWKDHGVSFEVVNKKVEFGAGFLYAPDCICKEGIYYLYFCLSDGSEGVATSKRPEGPFYNPKPIIGMSEKGIDPAVFIDEDGSAYYYWGQFQLYGGRLKEDMATLEKESITKELLTEKQHGFHEGASVRKRNGIYYLIYTDISRGNATCLAYATSDSPLGPFVKGGIIIDNTGCDPKTWNNHGSIAQIKDQWYVFYHRSSQNSKYSRRVCVEPIFFGEKGEIAEVEMTSQGVEPYIKASELIEASRCAKLVGKAFIETATTTIPYVECIRDIHDGDEIIYRYLMFSNESRIEITVESTTYGGEIEVWIEGDTKKKIGIIKVNRTNGFIKLSDRITLISGIYALRLKCKGMPGCLFKIKSFQFLD